MLTAPDFEKKQIIVVFFNQGERLAFSNDNILVKKEDGTVKFQCTCYRLFLIYGIGHCSITSALIQQTARFGFRIALFTPGFRLYALLGEGKEGNTLLHTKQYAYRGLEIAKVIVKNKMSSQYRAIMELRKKES